ncbi:MAG: AraC family transcriptional regulator [Sphingomonadaceae bacterium]|nr:AraC family transcriptional regulator [Sphingomonadaceae bacterium]
MGQDCDIDVRFFRPPPDLEGCFTTFSRLELTVPDGGTVQDYLQPEWANLRFFKGQPPVSEIPGGPVLENARLTATGPSSLPGRFELGTTRMWGIGLFPLGWARFIGVDASAHANQVVNGETDPVFARFGALADRLFTEDRDDETEFERLVAFFRSVDEPVKDEPRIRAVHAAIVDTDMSTVAELADRAGLSTRSLERLCRRHFGFSPKLLLRRQRFMRSLAAFMLHEGKHWSEVIDNHYHDQAHFVREFQAFMTMNPSEYAALPHPVLSAFMAERKRIWGSPAQTLDKP